MPPDDRTDSRVEIYDFLFQFQKLMFERKLLFELLFVFHSHFCQVRLPRANPSLHQPLQRLLFLRELFILGTQLTTERDVLLMLSKRIGQLL